MPERKLPVYYSLLAIFLLLIAGFVLFRSFQSLDYEWDFSILKEYLWQSDGQPGLFLQGLSLTIKISLYSVFFGLVLGALVGLFALSQEPVTRKAAILYIDVFRNTPLLVQIYVFYFVVGTAFGLSDMFSSVMTLSLFSASFIADLIRGALANFERGQLDAAKSLGFSHWQSAQHVVIPQLLRRLLPPLVGQFVSLVKDSSLVAVIGIAELTKSAQSAVSVTFKSFEVWFFVALLYFLVNTLLSTFGRVLEKRMAQAG